LRLAIVIVSYQVRDLLARCLDSVASRQSPVGGRPVSGVGRRSAVGGRSTLDARPMSVDIWVVDNASTDGSAEMVRRRFPDVRLIANDENRGFAAANNQALRRLLQDDTPDYVLLLNPDTEVLGGALQLMVEYLELHAEVGAAGPALVYPDGQFQHSAFAFPGLAQLFLDLFPLHGRLTESRLNGRYPRRWYAAGVPFAIGHPLGAALMVRRPVIEQVGLLDEGFFMYGEEVDWCWRMRKAGWATHCVPRAQIVHHEGRSTAQFREAMFVALWRSRRRLYARHHGPLTNWLAGQIVRARIRRNMRQDRARAARGALDETTWQSRRRAYEAVLETWDGATAKRRMQNDER